MRPLAILAVALFVIVQASPSLALPPSSWDPPGCIQGSDGAFCTIPPPEPAPKPSKPKPKPKRA